MNTKLPEGWDEVELGEVLDYEQPTKYIVKSTKYDDKFKTPVLTAGKSFLKGYTNETEGIYDDLPVIIFDDFTTASQFVTFPFKVKSSAMKILTTKRKDVSLKYIFYLMQTIKFDSKTHKRYYLSKYQNLNIPLPPIETQEAIVSLLEKAEKAKELRDEADELSKDYLKSVFVDMFEKKGMNEIELDKVTEITMGQSPPGNSYNEKREGTPFFQGKSEFTEKYPVVKKWTTKPTKMAKPNSVLMSVRAPVGSVNLCNIDCCIGRGLASISPTASMTLEFLYSLLQAMEDKIANLGSGSTFKAITSKNLRELKIPLPPIELQNKFAEIVKQVESMKEHQKESKDQIDNLFNALMQKAFKGELKC